MRINFKSWDIIPTHNSLRNVNSFLTFIKNPELIVSCKTPPVVMYIEDKVYLHDGHHRVSAAAYLKIPMSELVFTERTYDYQDLYLCNFATGWLTPFDPRIEVRNNNCLVFKQQVLKVLETDGISAAYDFIANNKHLYIEKRVQNTIWGLIPYEHIAGK